MAASSNRWVEYKAVVEARLDYGKIYNDIQGAKPSGNGHMVGLCPFHEDSSPSFGFSTTTGAWECFAGCGKGSTFDYLMRTSGREFKDVLVELGQDLGLDPPTGRGDASGTDRTVYSYHDEHGQELFQVVRGADKKFWQRRPNGQGGYQNGLKDVRRVLYRLPEILARQNEPVLVVEGEKDADRLTALGLLATTNPGGAGKWRKEYAACLEGRDVVILPDNDEPGRKHALQVARSLHGTAASVKIVDLPGLPEKGDVSDWLDAGHAAGDLQDQIGKKVAEAPLLLQPQILISGRQMPDLVTETWQCVLVQNQPPTLFVSGGQLARLVDSDVGPKIQHLDETIAYGMLARCATWLAENNKGFVDVRPPRDVASDILVNPHPDLPFLDSIVATPVFSADGTLLREPGYHQQAHLWLHRTGDLDKLDVPGQPTGKDVNEAIDLLCADLLVDFPFANKSDQAHALGALILPFVRRMITGPTPIHLVEAPTPGSGKGLMADLVSLIALGRPCESTTVTRSEDELRKKLTAILSRGHPVVVLDNIQGGLDSAQIAAAITAEVWSDRVLGKTQMVDFPNRALWIATANNPRLSMEIARRCVRIRLEPSEEQPWQRTGFKHHPLREWTRRHRCQLVRAVLVIIQSWIAAERPVGTQNLGSFESWAETIGGILEAAGITEFLQGCEEFYAAADPDSGEWAAFVQTWWSEIGAMPSSTRCLLALAKQHDLLTFAYVAKNEAAEMARFGKALAGMRGRKFGELEITIGVDSNRKANSYRLRPASGQFFNDKESV